MEHGHDDFRRRPALFRMDIYRYAAAIVADADGTVLVNRHGDVVAKACQRFVDRIVDDFENHMVQAGTVVGIADIHAGTLADGFEALKDFDIATVVLIAHASRQAWPRPGGSMAMGCGSAEL